MSFRVLVTARAERDFWIWHDYIHQRSAAGAKRWVQAFDKALLALEKNPSRGVAPESEGYDEPIREKLFKTRRGLTYRLLFVVRDETVFVIHVRGPGQDTMRDDEIELPPAD